IRGGYLKVVLRTRTTNERGVARPRSATRWCVLRLVQMPASERGLRPSIAPPSAPGSTDVIVIPVLSRAVDDEPVSGARLGHEMPRRGRVRLQLASQLRYVDVQVVRLVAVRRAPHLA